MARKLDLGDRLPELVLQTTGGHVLRLPDGLDADYTILLFYRGHW
jgi:peroxiredoxin